MRKILLPFFLFGSISILLAGTPYEVDKAIIPFNSSSSGGNQPLALRNSSKEATSAYVVRPGDSLWKIAARFLGDGARYWELVELNKDRYPSIAKNPNLIYPGWSFKIPGTAGGRKNTGKPGSSSGYPQSNPNASKPSNDSPDLAGYKGGRLPPAEFVRLFGPVARESMKRTGIPASVILAISANETGWGKSSIGDAKNLFGIKGTGPAGSIRVPTQEYYNGRYVTVQDNFRKYNSWGESIDDFGKLITQASRYRNAMNNRNNPDQFARELQKAGYATDPQYANKLINIMRTYNLYQYNK